MLTARNSHFLHVVGRVRRDAGWNAVRDDMRDVVVSSPGNSPQPKTASASP